MLCPTSTVWHRDLLKRLRGRWQPLRNFRWGILFSITFRGIQDFASPFLGDPAVTESWTGAKPIVADCSTDGGTRVPGPAQTG